MSSSCPKRIAVVRSNTVLVCGYPSMMMGVIHAKFKEEKHGDFFIFGNKFGFRTKKGKKKVNI